MTPKRFLSFIRMNADHKSTDMKYIVLIVSFFLLSPQIGQAQFKDLLKKAEKAKSDLLGDDKGGLDISGGLKQALEKGVGDAVESLSATNGYLESPYKVVLPTEAQTVVSKLKMVPGFQDVEEKLISKMNAAAETAAKKATPIFVDAIKGMSFKDAKNILMGQQNAATQYLETSTRKNLYTEFLPVIQSALDEVGAREYWTKATRAYNNLPFVKQVNPNLDDHVNNKALDGLFGLIQIKEKKIRNDVRTRDTPLLKEVFAQQDQS